MSVEWNPTRALRLALYARVSSERQAEEETINSQVALLRQRIEADGGVVDPEGSFIDDGVSGTTLIRPGLERLRDQAAAGMVDRVYVLAPDRLARRHAHQMVLVEELQSHGVAVVFVNRPVGNTPEDQLLLQVQGVIAEYERAKIMERTRRGRLHAARCGRVSVLGKAPYGYRYVKKEDGGGAARYEVIEAEADVVRQIFAWVAREGCSLADVVRRLEQRGIRPRHSTKGWRPRTIWGMLRNSAYRGQAAFGKTRSGERRPRLRPLRGRPEIPKAPYARYPQPATEHIAIEVPALVDDDVFAAVQERLEENRRRLRQGRRAANYLLQGLLVCADCGYAVCGRCAGARTNGFTYYFCPGNEGNRFGGQRLCRTPSQRTEDLDTTVWQDVCTLLSEPERLREEFERRQENPASLKVIDERERLRARIRKMTNTISRLIDIYAEGVLDKDEFEPRIRMLKERLRQLESELQTVEQQVQQQDELRMVYSRWEEFAEQMKAGLSTVNWHQKREILRALIKRVEVGNQVVRIVYKVPERPFVDGPKRGHLQDCLRRLPTGVWRSSPVYLYKRCCSARGYGEKR